MSMTLTGLAPNIIKAVEVVSREQTGLVSAVTRNFDAARAALNDEVKDVFTPPGVNVTMTPAVNAPTGSQTLSNVPLTITKTEGVPFTWTGEQALSMRNQGALDDIIQRQFQQAMRKLVNLMEADLAALYTKASRAYSTIGAVPFATAGDYTAASFAKKILVDNGAPTDDGWELVIDTTAGATLAGKQPGANFQGTDDLLRRGVLLDTFGGRIRQSGFIPRHTKGTASGATTNNAGYAVGATVITLASAGTGTIVAGDAIALAGDSNVYIVASGDTDVSNGGTITLAQPGLRVAITTSATDITLLASSQRNFVFTPDAIHLAARAPALPDGGDGASDIMLVTDEKTGLTFEVAQYGQFRQKTYIVSAAWGVAVKQPQHFGLLIY